MEISFYKINTSYFCVCIKIVYFLNLSRINWNKELKVANGVKLVCKELQFLQDHR